MATKLIYKQILSETQILITDIPFSLLHLPRITKMDIDFKLKKF